MRTTKTTKDVRRSSTTIRIGNIPPTMTANYRRRLYLLLAERAGLIFWHSGQSGLVSLKDPPREPIGKRGKHYSRGYRAENKCSGMFPKTTYQM